MTKALFVCVENSCRSQMAEAFARALGGPGLEVWSAGSRSSGEINPRAVAVMKEKGIDLGGQRSKGISELPPGVWDYVITMGCGDACPHIPAKRRVEWQIPNPSGQSFEFFREVRDQIEGHVKQLLLMIQEMRE